MHDQLELRYIRTGKKLRAVLTYKDPNGSLRQEHKSILNVIRNSTYPSKFAKAYISNRGIFVNAKAHMYNDIFFKFDIKNFFNNVDHEIMVQELFRESGYRGKISREECERIVEVCSGGEKGLPLGLVTSPDLANLYLKHFDAVLYGKLKLYPVQNIIYTRYADDMIISFKYHPDYQVIFQQIRADLIDNLKEYKLELNEEKTEIVDLTRTNHVRITGVSVIKKEDNYRHISVGKKLKNEIFWQAINIYDTAPEKRNADEVKKLKGMMSFILSIEKEGISFTYSRNMRQLVYDRGFRNLPELVKNL